jgi:hypothetical protein
VPFLIGSATVVLAAMAFASVHRALSAADAGLVHQPEVDDVDRLERERELAVGAAVGNEG